MRRRSLLPVLAAFAVAAHTVAGTAPPREIDNVAAFARLFGTLRYFYPSDAAAALDWNAYAVLGVGRVRTAPDARALEAALRALVDPLGPGIVIGATLEPARAPGAPDRSLIAWRYLGAAVAPAGPYRAKRTNRAPAAATGIDGFVTLMQNVPAPPHRGKAIRLSGRVRAAARENGAAQLWLRVDRPNQQPGFFDNMGNRPALEPAWREYVIEGTVADDAVNVAFGVMASGNVTADFESVSLSVKDQAGTWTPIEIKDAGFEADGPTGGWFRAGSSATAVVTRPSDQAPEGRQYLRMAPGAVATGASTAELFDAPAPSAGAHVDIDLGSGLKARVPVALTETEAAGDSSRAAPLDALRKNVEGVGGLRDSIDVNTRLADVVVAWNVYQHFYPYWDVVKIDWNARLASHLERAYDAATREAQQRALRRLVADVQDGHGSVTDLKRGPGQPAMPVAFGRVEGRIVVTASGVSDVPVGSVVTSIDGEPADKRLADTMPLASGTVQWREWRSLQEIRACGPAATAVLEFDAGKGAAKATVRCEAQPAPQERRPAPIAELSTGVWYVDLTRARAAELTSSYDALSRASGVVFDVRGYPTDAGANLLPHLVASTENDRWMHVNRIVGPNGTSVGWQSVGWNIAPASPHIAGKVVFLTDGRAISYAESVMGYVADRKLGTIVGATTAGANGNVVSFPVPGAFNISFTGMKVTGHDGEATHHTIGVKPDVALSPTIAGIRAGRDELLERALALIRER